ncbi:MAG: succinylglutamate desuccinylase/aspartoacylase family protein [Gammaproteobacteria bacterium]|nr:succinylglutamate desuccinylase/aspartoacylase family protein [Gammaproteobacteria bacterium]MCB1874144.1 succinylglutamate desuccinylase/aspartoacylase family protein [Gammaproteobacteria bacterium]MCB1902670.1 succinylglutamate desuccinylase/aspartoacylase family protein [Gammaproteobacteria bacterium]
MLQELDQIPPGLLDLKATQLQAALGGPTLIHLEGRRRAPLLVSVLMHGNETTGWEAVRTLLRPYASGEEELPRSLSLFIGNVSAAAVGLRRLDGQPDYNRVWPGCEDRGTPEHLLMRYVMETMRAREVFASIDVHNNTGINPHYACVNIIDNRFLHLATMFGRTVVYFIRPCGVQSLAMAKICPAVTLECGKPGQLNGVEHARDYLNACLHLAEHPEHPLSPRDIDLFHTVATVKVRADTTFGFGGESVDIRFEDDLEYLNFRELASGTRIGWINPGNDIGLEVINEQGSDVTHRYFSVEDEALKLRVPVMPSMLTRDLRVVRQDCLCYLMERYNDHLL